MYNKNKRSDLKYNNKTGDAKRISRQLIAIFHSVQLRPRDYLKSFQSARTCSSFRVSLHILDDLVSPIFVAIQLHGYSLEYRESPLRFSSRNEVPASKFSRTCLRLRTSFSQSSLFSETSPETFTAHRHFALFIPTWTMAEPGGPRTKDSPPERFKSIRFSAFEIRISARSRASVAQVLALNFLAFGTFPFSYTYGISRRSRCRFLSPSLSLSSSSSPLLSVS